MKTFGQILKQKREIRGWSQREVSRRIGMHPNNLCNYERDISAPNMFILVDLADLFECSLDELVGRKRPNENLKCNMPDNLVINGVQYKKNWIKEEQ